MTRIQLSHGFIDLPKDTDFPIDLAFAEITKNGTRSGGFSRALDIEGTANNIEVLGMYFDIDLDNGQLNRNKKTTCSIVQNGVDVFDGYIQLLEIIRVNKLRGTNTKSVKYKISVFDEVGNFFNEMGEKELSALAFPEFSHDFNRTNIIASWSNTGGYTYPQFAKPNNIYTLRDFKPAIYEWEYFKKIFQQNGYSFTFAEYNTAKLQMHKRIIPYNGKQSDEVVTKALQNDFSVQGEMATDVYNMISLPSWTDGYLPLIDATPGFQIDAWLSAIGSKIQLSTVFQDAQAQYLTATDEIENKAGQGRTWNIQTSYDYELKVRAKDGGITPWEVVFTQFGVSRCDVILTLIAQSTTDVNKIAIIDSQQVATSFLNGGTYSFPSGFDDLASGTNSSYASLGVFDQGEKYDIHAFVMARYITPTGGVTNNPNNLPCRFKKTGTSDNVELEFEITINDLQLKAVPDITELVKGSNVDVSLFIPKKIKQRDIIASISKSYNLLFVPDPNNERNIIIKTRDKYYSDGAEWDWTDKICEDQENTISFLSNEVPREQTYKYKEDKDEINTAYQNEVGETYGQTSIQLDNEYSVGNSSREIIYSPTPSIQCGLGWPLPSINGINPDNNIRVLLHNGTGSVFAYPFYDDLLPNATELLMVSTYCKTSMFDDDFKPNFSILFNAPKFLFHGQQQGQTTNYLYNLHHQNELTTINEGKKLTAYFDLSESDFQKLSKRLDWKIFIQDNGWFIISKIYGYNSGKRTITKVDLVTADDKTKLKYIAPAQPTYTPSATANNVNEFMNEVLSATNIIVGNAVVMGGYNLVIGDNVTVLGSQNVVLSSSVQVMGDNNTVATGLDNTKILGDGETPTERTILIGEVR